MSEEITNIKVLSQKQIVESDSLIPGLELLILRGDFNEGTFISVEVVGVWQIGNTKIQFPVKSLYTAEITPNKGRSFGDKGVEQSIKDAACEIEDFMMAKFRESEEFVHDLQLMALIKFIES